MDERWLPVVGHEGFYEISNHGRVRSLERRGEYAGRWRRTVMMFPARVMKTFFTPTGYETIPLRLPDKPTVKFLVHRLVARAFIGEPPIERPEVNHLDGVKRNNHVSNLEYCSSQENHRHCIDVLGKRRGEGAGAAAKLKERDIPAIRADSRSLRVVARDYGVTLQAIWLVKKRKNWAHVA